MFKKGMLINAESFDQFKRLLKDIEEQTDFKWVGYEGSPTNMRDSAFYEYKDSFGLRIRNSKSNRVIEYGIFSKMVEDPFAGDCKITTYVKLYQAVRRF
jgi:hypothetical protein